MVVIMIMTLKGVIQDFFTISSLRCHLSPAHTLQWPGRSCERIMCNISGAYDVQYVVCHVVRRGSSAIQFDRVEVAFILALFYWLNPLTNEGEEENGVPREKNPMTSFDTFSVHFYFFWSINWSAIALNSVGESCQALPHVLHTII